MKVKQSVESSSESEESSSEDEKPAPKPRVIPQRTFVQDEPDEDGNLMLRKRSKAYLENGKVFQSTLQNSTVSYSHYFHFRLE